MSTTTRHFTGWCGTASHPRDDHERLSSCVAFISDDDHTALLLEEARRHDRLAAARSACDAEARYVAQWRPY